jgi:organic radical activating enzyme
VIRLSVQIRHKGIDYGVLSDAPFVGARICAIQCHEHCPGCFNQERIDEPYVTQDIDELFDEIKKHPINEGIILGGLEWSEQPDELRSLVLYAHAIGMQVIIYTHLDIKQFLEQFWTLRELENVYVKCGEYRQELEHYYDEQHDVTLASTNQIICKLSDLR